MHDSNLIVVENVDNPAIEPDLFSASHRNIGIFGESQNSNSTLLKNIIDRAAKLETAIFGLNISRIFDSKFYKWQAESSINNEVSKFDSVIWGTDDDSNRASDYLDRLVVRAIEFDKSVLFIHDSTPLLRNPKVSRHLGSLCASSMKYGLQVILTAESSRACSQKVIKNLGNRFVVLSQFRGF